MEMMELVSQFLTIVIPAALVLFGMYLAVKSFLDRESRKSMIELKSKSQEHVLPLRLQAYERMCLLLERVSPGNIILRVNDPSFSVAGLHAQLISEIRNELNHNLSQQVYISDQAWEIVKKGVEDTVAIINQCSQQVDPEAKGIELAKVVFDRIAQDGVDPALASLAYVKNEARQLF